MSLMENKNKTHTIQWDCPILANLRLTNLQDNSIGRSSAWRKFIYSRTSVKPPHRKRSSSSFHQKTNVQTFFKKYYKSSLQAVKVKLQSGLLCTERNKRNKKNPNNQTSRLSSTENEVSGWEWDRQRRKKLRSDFIATFCVKSKWQNKKSSNVWFNPGLVNRSSLTDFHVPKVFVGRKLLATLCNSWRLTMFLRWIDTPVLSSPTSNLSHTRNQNQINKPHFNYLTQKNKKKILSGMLLFKFLLFLYVSTKIKALIYT